MKANECIAKITWKSQDGYQFIGFALGHDWDIIQTTSDKFRSLQVGDYVHCREKTDEDFGIYLEEIMWKSYASEETWKEQEKNYQ